MDKVLQNTSLLTYILAVYHKFGLKSVVSPRNLMYKKAISGKLYIESARAHIKSDDPLIFTVSYL